MAEIDALVQELSHCVGNPRLIFTPHLTKYARGNFKRYLVTPIPQPVYDRNTTNLSQR
ncbi:hypothetical protein K469DRAFT_704993 [Zopfia rhizophila CBS 207.26]|uniref:Uncharacterized protein n=1 Tax=Zopfia rhizophila CBS 207.26 TaxID=1314779 RepID=A0A6A6E5V5_9PEZI|nr:hypothetical protein K469DRAFT_704993 [Zopfia rhizophila CBS 207.26]